MSEDKNIVLKEVTVHQSSDSLAVKQFTWSKVGLVVASKVGKKTVDKAILLNQSGSISAGQVVAIMGGSGAGKSTLLNSLAGRIGPGKLSGEILVDGNPRNSATWRTQCAYVEQGILRLI